VYIAQHLLEVERVMILSLLIMCKSYKKKKEKKENLYIQKKPKLYTILRGKTIRVTLWNSTATQIDDEFYKNNLGPFIIIVTSTTIKTFGGIYIQHIK
jgi:hypothetical protein